MSTEEDRKNLRGGCIGCLGIVGVLALVLIVGTMVYKSQPTSLNDASRYAQRLHTLIYADAVAASFLAHANEHSAGELYEVARRMADDAGNFSSTIDAPSEFTESGNAFAKYANQLQDSYTKTANSLNNPSLERSYDMLRAIALDNRYTQEAIEAFKRDLAKSHFTSPEKRRILSRLVG